MAVEMENTAPIPQTVSENAARAEADGKPEEKKGLTRLVPPEEGWTEWPAEWDPTKHLPLPKKAFKDKRVWARKELELVEEKKTRLQNYLNLLDKYDGDEEKARDAQKKLKSMESLKKDMPHLESFIPKAQLKEFLEGLLSSLG